MRRDFVTVSVHDSLDEAISIMRLARLRHLAVERDGVLVGLLSYRDLQDRALARLECGRLEPTPDNCGLAVEQAMLEAPYVVEPDTPLHEAATRICHLRVGCLPVVESDEDGVHLVGLVTELDLLRAAYASA
jgi:CBS domain-containing protein